LVALWRGVQQSLLFSLPPTWPKGQYVLFFEINVEGDYNATYDATTFATPTKPDSDWDTWAVGYGYPYRYGYPYAYGYPYGSYGYPLPPVGYVSAVPGYAYGGVRIQGAPHDAQVFADGYYVGIVDNFDGVFQHLNLQAGPHRIEIRAAGLPPIEVNGLVRLGTSPWRPQFQISQVWQILDNLSWLKGSHSFKFGYEHRHASNNFLDIRAPQGEIGANGIYVAKGAFGLPDFLLGNIDSVVFVTPTVVHNYQYANSFYVQDTWRVSNRLTLTLSLRGEFEQGATERYNRMIIDYDKNAVLPISALAEAAYAKSPVPELPVSQFKVLGGALYAGTTGAPQRAWGSQLMWLPRAGFGYQVNTRTVVRGGYGIYYDTLNVNAISFGGNQTGFSRGTNPTITNDNGVNWLVGDPKGLVSALNDPFPVRASQNGTRFDEPLRNALGNMALAGAGWTYLTDKHPRQQRWRVGVERQVGSANVVEAFYEGTWTSDLNINVSQSPIPSTYYSRSNVRDAAQDGNMSGAVTNPFNIANFASLATSNPVVYQDMSTKSFYTSTTITKSNLIRAYPNGNITTPNPLGKARSQQFAASFNHRFSKGLTANFAYTAMIAKSATGYFQPWSPFDPVSPQVPYWTRGGASPHRIAATWVYDLPFGKGRQWIHGTLPSLLVGGWTLSGTYEYSPGGLLGFGSNFYYGDVNGIKIDNPTFDHYFNTAGCVSTAAAAGPGDTVVGSGPCTQGWEKRTGLGPATFQARSFPTNIDGLRGPGYQQWNTSVTRKFKIKERLGFETRLDTLNLLNHSFLGGPNTTPSSSQFGQITGGAANLNRFVQIQGHLRW
jgi:hypothetical protein